MKQLQVTRCTLIGHSIGGKMAAVFARNNLHMIDAILFISGSSIPIHEDDLEDSVAIKLASARGMAAVADYEREKTLPRRKHFKMMVIGTVSRKYLQKLP